MARPKRMGIDYFQADVDMFEDRKIKRLLRAAGGKGITIYIYLLTRIYRDKGYYYEWDKHSAFDISDDLNFSESVVEETVKACCSIGLFNEDLYSAESILSSESIQDRWQKIVTDANRVDTDIDPKYSIKDGKGMFLCDKGGFTGKETPEKYLESTQRKGEDSKEEDRRGPAHKPDDLKSVIKFFENNNMTKDQAEEFYHHFNGQGWVRQNGMAITSWQSIAVSWIKREKHNKPEWKKAKEQDLKPIYHQEI